MTIEIKNVKTVIGRNSRTNQAEWNSYINNSRKPTPNKYANEDRGQSNLETLLDGTVFCGVKSRNNKSYVSFY